MANGITGFQLAASGVNLSPNAVIPEQKATVTAPSVSNTKIEKKSFRYPLAMLDSTTDYLQINVIEFKNRSFSLSSVNSDTLKNPKITFDLPEASSLPKNILKTIYLPIPSGISDSNSTSWGEENLNPIEATGAAAGVTAIQNGISQKSITDVVNNVTATADALLNNPQTQKAIQYYFAGQAASQLPGANITGAGLLTRATGQVINNNQELLFQGPSLRSFNFNFDFSPRNQKEATEVKDIIRIFKQSMAAKKGGPKSVQGLFINSPDLFELRYKSGQNDHPFLNQFKTCALTNVTVNYTGSGAYATYPDGTPVHITMALSFQELNPIYAEDYDTSKGRNGVGY